MTRALRVLAICSCAATAAAQERPASFEAATVKPVAPGFGPMAVRMRGGPRSNDPGRFTATNVTLLALLLRAFDVPSYRIAAPSWLSADRFEVVATIPPSASESDFRAMLRNLLAERFRLETHWELRQSPVYVLTLDRGRPKLKEFSPDPQGTDGSRGMPPLDARGFPVIPAGQPGVWKNFNGSHFLIQAHGVSASELARMLEEDLSRPVIDETSLAGSYNFILEYAPPQPRSAPAEDDEPALSLFSAVKQLGLKLQSRKSPIQMLVVDRLERRPVEN